ncbi:MAG: hypothetical protein IJ180_08965 [Bacteroidales bacterium]|nr:hypothetical protein [Bacteroidales bacterium]
MTKEDKKQIKIEFDNHFIFLLKTANIFAQMSYDITEELKNSIKEYNEKLHRTTHLNSKFTRAVNKMEQHRQLMGHYALSVTDQLQTLFEVMEDSEDNQIKPLSYFVEMCETYECFIELLATILFSCNENHEYLKEFWQRLKQELDGRLDTITEVTEPQWNKLDALGTTIRQGIKELNETKI